MTGTKAVDITNIPADALLASVDPVTGGQLLGSFAKDTFITVTLLDVIANQLV
jgi:hypothetical protein